MIKRSIIFFLITLFFFSAFSQSSLVKRQDLTYKMRSFRKLDGSILSVPVVTNTSISPNDFLPYYTELVQLPNNTKLNSVEILHQEWEIISNPIDEQLNNSITENLNIEFKEVEERKVKKALVSFVPLKKEGAKTYYLKSFELKLNTIAVVSTNKKSITTVTNSVLSSGDWYKLAILNDGVYKITYDFLKKNGISVSNLKSDWINIFGNGVGLLDEDNSIAKPDDLLKNAIKVVDGGDGVFDEEDYILFYAHGPHKIEYSGGTFSHKLHIYSDTAYYFLSINSSQTPKRIQTQNQVTSGFNKTITTFDELKFYEPEQENFIESGRRWWGNKFGAISSSDISFTFSNINKANNVEVRSLLAGRSFVNQVNFTITDNTTGAKSVSGNASAIPVSHYSPYARDVNCNFNFKPNSDVITLNVQLNKFNDPDAEGWIDYIEVMASRNLIMSSNQMVFSSLASVGVGSVSKFILSNAQDVSEIWDITSTDVTSINYTIVGSQKEFVVNTDNLKTFVSVSKSHNFSTPIFSKKIENQNLHSLGYADLIIISPSKFYSEAQGLKEVHEAKGTSVHLVKIEEVFNEFSSGMHDATAIKLFMKMFYDRASNPDQIPKHLLLFGDGSYDNRDKIQPNTNFILTYQSEESLVPTNTFTSDDYFVTLSDNEAFNNYDLIDMGVGRFPVKTQAEALHAVEKVKIYLNKESASYEEEASCGNTDSNASSLKDWRSNVVLVADDEDNAGFVDDAENVYSRIEKTAPELNVSKLYLDAYKQEKTPGGQRYPQVETELVNKVQNGTLLLNYVGHGGESGWTQERILTTTTVTDWTNKTSPAIFMTATCQFSRWDNTSKTSGGELAFLNPRGAATALYTTTRVVFDSQNGRLIGYFFDSVFVRTKGVPKDLGRIYMDTKNAYANFNNDIEFRKFSLLGDPAIQLGLPLHKTQLTKLNDIDITSSSLDTLKALSKSTIEGIVTDQNGTFLSDFNGITYVTIFDKKKLQKTLQNDEKSALREFEIQNNILFKGRVSVKNGVFSSTFVVPKDINYQYGKGKVSMYSENGTEDAIGYSDSLVVGGINENALEDKVGPTIKLYLNDSTFVNGGMTNESPILIAKLSDENGINTAGNGIGHDLSIILDNNYANPISLNEYYEAELDSYQNGQIQYPLSELSTGKHSVILKAYDVYNNPSSQTIEFYVTQKEKISIEHVLNYPNPFTTHTQFMFEHNQACAYLRVRIEIYTISGKLVKTIKQNAHAEGFNIQPIEWNGRDEFGDKLARGVYVYKIRVENLAGESVEKFEKLVILN